MNTRAIWKDERAVLKMALLIAPIALIIIGFLAAFIIDPATYNGTAIVFAVTTSLSAAAIWYCLFFFYDQRVKAIEDDAVGKVRRRIDELELRVGANCASTIRAYERLNPVSVFGGGRVLFAQHPTEQVALAIEAAQADRSLVVEAIGISLSAFVNNHLSEIAKHSNVELHIILPKPDGEALKLMCAREKRDHSRVVGGILETTKKLHEKGKLASVRWQHDIATITAVRVGSTIYWRPRLANEELFSKLFYHEIQRSNNSELFELLKQEMKLTWDDAYQPLEGDLQRLLAQ